MSLSFKCFKGFRGFKHFCFYCFYNLYSLYSFPHHIQFFLKKYASAKAVPNIAIIVTNPPSDSTAIPLRAEPLVQPLPSCDPKPKSTPPPNASNILFLDVIFGECSTLNFRRPEMAPERNPPTITPSISKTNHVFIGLPVCDSLNSFTNPDVSTDDGATVVIAVTTVLLIAPLAPSPRPATKFAARRTIPSKTPPKYGLRYFVFLIAFDSPIFLIINRYYLFRICLLY